MKKILSTTLAAVALSIAMVGTVDARRMAPSSERDLARAILADAKAIKEAPKSGKPARAEALLADLMANADIADLTELDLQRKQIGADLESERAKLATIKTGWFFNTQEYKDQQKIVSDLNTQLRDKNKQIANIRKDLPKESSNATLYGVAAVIGAIGVAAALEYWYMGEESRVKAGMTYVGAKGSEAKTYLGKQYRQRAPKFMGGEEVVVATEQQ